MSSLPLEWATENATPIAQQIRDSVQNLEAIHGKPFAEAVRVLVHLAIDLKRPGSDRSLVPVKSIVTFFSCIGIDAAKAMEEAVLIVDAVERAVITAVMKVHP